MGVLELVVCLACLAGAALGVAWALRQDDGSMPWLAVAAFLGVALVACAQSLITGPIVLDALCRLRPATGWTFLNPYDAKPSGASMAAWVGAWPCVLAAVWTALGRSWRPGLGVGVATWLGASLGGILAALTLPPVVQDRLPPDVHVLHESLVVHAFLLGSVAAGLFLFGIAAVWTRCTPPGVVAVVALASAAVGGALATPPDLITLLLSLPVSVVVTAAGMALGGRLRGASPD